jgi:hypothetical protein
MLGAAPEAGLAASVAFGLVLVGATLPGLLPLLRPAPSAGGTDARSRLLETPKSLLLKEDAGRSGR